MPVSIDFRGYFTRLRGYTIVGYEIKAIVFDRSRNKSGEEVA